MNHLGAIHSIETFGSVDGPGVRFVVFLKGCNMRCKYCHNADTWKIEEGETKASDLLKKALRYKPYWKEEGGITVSGGEPLLQIDFVTELFSLAKKEKVKTALDTSGQPFNPNDPVFMDKFNALVQVTDLVLLDIKHIDTVEHKKLTGWGNENIKELARYLNSIHKPVWVRHVLVPGVTDKPEPLAGLKDFLSTLENIQKIEVLPYHDLGAYKWKELQMEYPLKDTPVASADRAMEVQKYLIGK